LSNREGPHRWLFATFGILGFAVVALVLAFTLVPRFRWRAQLVRLKASGTLPDISWKELWQLARPGDPFNLHELLKTPSPYVAIKNPFTSAADLAAGKAAFQAHCTVCHGANGVGGPGGPALKQWQMRKGNSDWAIFETISLGVSGTAMPASTLPENDRWRLVAYVNSLVRRPKIASSEMLASKISGLEPVGYEDILDAQGHRDRWLTYSGTYDGQRFSMNDQITPSNARRLRLLWMRQYTTSEAVIETSPLVFGGFMFLTAPPNRVEALDARTGERIWQYDRELPANLSLCCGYVNRGLAVLGSTLFLGTLDAHLVALDMRTGQVLWDVEIADYKSGYSITSAPLAIKNMIITGVAGGEFGIRGFVDARDAATGEEIWKFETIPHPGQPGAETWDTNALETGGGPTWLTGTFDPQSNVLYWPVGNPSPNFNGDSRKGDNLYTNCVLALDADHGTLRWYFQFTPHDVFDWDATEILVAFDRTVAGKKEHLLAQADRNAFYYILDRDSGRFLTARPFAKQTWAQKIDSRGRPQMDPAAVPTPKGATVYPAVDGASNWMSPSYSPVTGFLYVPTRDWGGIYYSGDPQYEVGKMFTAGYFWLFTNPQPVGAVRALNAATGEVRWEHRNSESEVGGTLSTKGGVVFGSAGQYFFALHAKTGKELWRIDTGGPIRAAPITYSLDGRQVVTLAAGHDLFTFGL
jgi:alcohol dehydrogenase (cytochrome c)